MQFRHARHTNNLEPLINFYTEIIGLEKLGGFKDHDDYEGVFLGMKNSDWHLEFTASHEKADHHFDEDDLIVFYFNTEAEIKAILKNAERNNVALIKPKNQYWESNGHTFLDPDGFIVVISLRPPALISGDGITKTILENGINNWNDLTKQVQNLPYGRNSGRSDFSLVIKENKGTCSSKHALLKKIADLNNIKNVSLILCIYKMTEYNTPKIGHVLTDNSLECIPEAHCYLKLNGNRIDFTGQNAEIAKIEKDILTEMEIQPEQVVDFKIDFHKDFLRQWLKVSGLKITFDEIWEIREKCIANLAE